MAGMTMSLVEGGSHRKRLTAAEVTAFEEASGQPVGETLEEALAEVPGQRVSTDHGSQEAAENWLHAARSYAQNRDPKIIFAGNSVKAGQARWSVEPKAPATEA